MRPPGVGRNRVLSGVGEAPECLGEDEATGHVQDKHAQGDEAGEIDFDGSDSHGMKG